MDEVYLKVEDLGWIKKYFTQKDLITIDDLIAEMEDLAGELEALQEEYDDFQEDVRENYTEKKFNPYHEYGLREGDFH